MIYKSLFLLSKREEIRLRAEACRAGSSDDFLWLYPDYELSNLAEKEKMSGEGGLLHGMRASVRILQNFCHNLQVFFQLLQLHAGVIKEKQSFGRKDSLI